MCTIFESLEPGALAAASGGQDENYYCPLSSEPGALNLRDCFGDLNLLGKNGERLFPTTTRAYTGRHRILVTYGGDVSDWPNWKDGEPLPDGYYAAGWKSDRAHPSDPNRWFPWSMGPASVRVTLDPEEEEDPYANPDDPSRRIDASLNIDSRMASLV
jgi:hypothetical protein